jgi:F-type H+-transporting ATPase subunit a
VPRKGCLGCSFPVLIGIIVIVVVLGVVSLLGGALGQSLFKGLNLPDWISVDKPHVDLPASTIFHVLGFPVTNSLLATWLSMIVLLVLAYAVTRKIKLVPSRLQALVEFALEWILNLCVDVAGEKYGRRFFPIITTIFLFVIMNAWLSLIPGFGSILVNAEGHSVHLLRGANTDINTPLALALFSFIFVEVYGITSLGGLTYMKKFVRVGVFFRGLGQLFRGKVGAGFAGIFNGIIQMFVGGLEALSELVRILSLTFRLFGNMTGGEILVLMMLFLVPWVLPIAFYGFELLVGLVQALIFSGLTLVYATMAVTPHEEEEH